MRWPSDPGGQRGRLCRHGENEPGLPTGPRGRKTLTHGMSSWPRGRLRDLRWW